MDKFRETLPRILAHNMLIWEWVRGTKNASNFLQKMAKMEKTGSCYGFMTKLDDNSTAHAKLQALYLPFVLKNGMESSCRRQERETNFDISTRLVSLLSKLFSLVMLSYRHSNILKVPMQYTNQVQIV